ncbi:type II toxin-antitoxin system CcdA family antitoxin [Alcaligenaceae bacterium]|nr:type II toxin-antitoxin system CcdA family antitoxin [Alcaligenaceae bacterium]
MRVSITKPSSRKRATNITLSVDVYEDAKALGINLSQTCDRLLREAINAEKANSWAVEHRDFVSAYNDSVEKDGLALSQWRTF